MNEIQDWVQQLLVDLHIIKDEPNYLDNILILTAIVLITFCIDYICRRVMLNAFKRIARKTKNQWDDLIVERKIINKMMHIIPAILTYVLLPIAFPKNEMPQLLAFLQKACAIYIIAVSLRFLNASLNVIQEIYSQRNILKNKPVKGFVQILQVALFFVGAILVISVVIDKSPVSLFAGLGASAAILMLVFKDTILGFVAGIQLSANDMLRPGDWITMEKYGANGTVIEVTLNAVKVRNFDNTITTIPPYALVSDAFQNWRSMKESGGRRIKRSINIDMNSVRFYNTIDELLEVNTIPFVASLMEEKRTMMKNWKNDEFGKIKAFTDRPTNLGFFRYYLQSYLYFMVSTMNHDMTFLVRYLQPTEKGLPIELYFFTTQTDWKSYETVQAEVIEHIIAVIPRFGLALFQDVSGNDLRNILIGLRPQETTFHYSEN